MSNYIYHFSEILLENNCFGAKTSKLAQLYKSGFNIPEGFGVSVDVFNSFCEYNNISMKDKVIEEKILNGNISVQMQKELKLIWDKLSEHGKLPLVVRSSAIEEDGEKNSYAGVFESILNVRSFDDMQNAIKKCWASYFTNSAEQYRKEKKASKGMGVLLQKMINSDVSGVTFTMNPINGKHEEVIVEAYPGLNIAVVDGTCSADKYFISRKGNILNQAVSEKKVYYSLSEKAFSLETMSIPTTEWKKPVLDKEVLKKILGICLKIEKELGVPCDIEWTIKNEVLYILQARYITTKNVEQKTDKVCFDSDIPEDVECSLLDRYSEPATTCYLSLLQSWEQLVYLDYYSRKNGRAYKEKPLLFYFNRVYWNLKYQREFFEDLPFESKGFKALIKKFKLIKLMLYGYKNWYKRLDKYNLYIEDFTRQNISGMELNDIGILLRQIIDIFCNYLGKDHFQFLGLAQVSYKLLSKKLELAGDSKEIISNILESRVSKNMTVQSNKELQSLVDEVNSNSDIKNIFINEKAESIYHILKGSIEKDAFKEKFDQFILKHGHRGTSCDDLFTPHWVEQPSIVIEMIKQYIKLDDEIALKDTKHTVAKEKETKREVYKQILIQDKNIVAKHIEAVKIMKLMDLTAEYMALRENQRYYFDKSWVLIRKGILAIGQKLYNEHLINDKMDIFHFTIEELLQICDLDWDFEKHNVKGLVASRKKCYEKNKKITPPYFIKGGDLVRLQKKGVYKSYKAVGISPGKAVGPTKIIRTIKDLGKVKHGDIVVVSTFHPSWTPILNVVSGLVMNYGNILSHGAVVAREYKIPVVVFNDVATNTFAEGQWLDIDGTSGRIRVPEVL